jgi:hypothetical protein
MSSDGNPTSERNRADFQQEGNILWLTNQLNGTIMQLPGAVGVAIVDLESGMSLGQAGGGSLNLEVAAAGNTEVVPGEDAHDERPGLSEEIEDILITLGTQYHIIRPLRTKGSAGLFVYVALEKSKANLAPVTTQDQRHSLHAVDLTPGSSPLTEPNVSGARS